MKHRIPDEHLGSVKDYLDDYKTSRARWEDAIFKAESLQLDTKLQWRTLHSAVWDFVELPIGTEGDIITEEDGSMYFKEVESATEKPDE